jgi:hypothetical protein
MKTIYALIPLFFFCCTKIAVAQCATGVDTGGECVPPDELNPQQAPIPRHQPQQPRAVWADRWGAVVDDPDGGAGTAENQPSKEEAIQAATSICIHNGGQHCKVFITYYNQCAAIAVGGGHANGSSAASKDKAAQQALDHCGDSNVCKIVYSACSLPVRVQ